MNIYNNLSDIKKIGNFVLCLGNFDGVHSGHKLLVEKAIELADDLNCCAGVYTFQTHSKLVLGLSNFSFITTADEKNDILKNLGVNFVFYDNFSAVKEFSPEQFCDYLVDAGVKAVVCGENYRFGKFACAGSAEMKDIMNNKGIICSIIPNHYVNNVGVSSTEIRRLISNGDTDSAAKLLGYRYFIETKVVHGAHLGTTLDFPTINQYIYGNKTIPAFGVYCTKCTIDGKTYNSITNVGKKPTVTNSDNAETLFETHIIDYSGDLYGKTLKIEFYKKLRDEMKFPSLEVLRENVLSNINEAKEYFKKEI